MTKTVAPSSEAPQIVFADGHDERIYEACSDLLDEGVVPTICGTQGDKSQYEKLINRGLRYIETPDGMEPQAHVATLMNNGEINGSISGYISNTGDIVRILIRNLEKKDGIKYVSSYFLMQAHNKNFLFSDSGLIPNPSANALVDIYTESVESAKIQGIETPRVAFLDGGYENQKLKETESLIVKAGNISQKRKNNTRFGGKFSEIYAQTDVFLFPNLNAGNIAYKIAERMIGFTSQESKNDKEDNITSQIFQSSDLECLFAYSTQPNTPSTDELVRTALKSVEIAREKGLPLRVAFLSYSTAGSGIVKDKPIESSLEPIIHAPKKFIEQLEKDGVQDVEVIGCETQFDAAFIPTIGQSKGIDITKPATIYIFPDRHTGSICSDIPSTIGGASAIGPLIQGFQGQAHDVSRGIDVATLKAMYHTVAHMIAVERENNIV